MTSLENLIQFLNLTPSTLSRISQVESRILLRRAIGAFDCFSEPKTFRTSSTLQTKAQRIVHEELGRQPSGTFFSDVKAPFVTRPIFIAFMQYRKLYSRYVLLCMPI